MNWVESLFDFRIITYFWQQNSHMIIMLIFSIIYWITGNVNLNTFYRGYIFTVITSDLFTPLYRLSLSPVLSTVTIYFGEPFIINVLSNHFFAASFGKKLTFYFSVLFSNLTKNAFDFWFSVNGGHILFVSFILNFWRYHHKFER